jgi:hypothetical protein
MRRLAAALLLLLVAAPLEAADPAPGFVAGTEDIPLMKGLANIADSLVVFDKPEGRIVESEAAGKVTRAAVEKFYATTLPQLGWTPDGAHAWRRESERLRLDLKGRDGDLHVSFTLSPR